MKPESFFLVLAALLGFLAVGLGAFGAHGLSTILSAKQLAIYKTAVDYQFYHTFALFLTALWLKMTTVKSKQLIIAGWAFFIGVLLFSGSLYILSVSSIKMIGMITPLGGLCFLVGWVALLLHGVKH